MNLQTNYRRTYSRYYRTIGPFLKKPRVKAYTMLVLSFFTMSFFGVFAIKPTLKTIARLQREIADNQLVNEGLDQKIIHLSQIKEEYKKIESDLPLISKALPLEPKFSFFLKDLETLAQEVGATISGVRLEGIDLTKDNSPLPENSLLPTNKISSSLSLNGNYHSCKDFLDWLLNSGRIYNVDRFNIHPGSIEEEGVIKLDLSVNAYYFDPNLYVQ